MVTRDPAIRNDQRRRVVHEVEQVIEPAARIGRRPTVKLGLHLRYPRPRPHRSRAGSAAIHQRIFRHCSILISSIPLPPFPMHRALPGSEYYGGSAPRPSRSADDVLSPAAAQATRRTGRPGTVPVFTVIRSPKEEPGSAPAASPRVRRRPSPQPPGHQLHGSRKFPAATTGGYAPLPALIRQVRASTSVEGL